MSNRWHNMGLLCLGCCVWHLSLTSAAATPGRQLPGRPGGLKPVTPASLKAEIKDPKSDPQTATFDRYAVIVTRMPFGDEAAAAAAAAAAMVANQPVQESFTKNMRLCAITRDHSNGKLQVGLLNVITKKNYFLYEGDSEDGIEVVKADYDNDKALVRKGAEETWMDMNTVVASVPSVVTHGPGGGMRIAPQTPPSPPAAPPKSAFNTPEELAQHLKDYQMDLIRAGGEKGPPLPMELTPEMDAKLVEEGVLAPAE